MQASSPSSNNWRPRSSSSSTCYVPGPRSTASAAFPATLLATYQIPARILRGDRSRCHPAGAAGTPRRARSPCAAMASSPANARAHAPFDDIRPALGGDWRGGSGNRRPCVRPLPHPDAQRLSHGHDRGDAQPEILNSIPAAMWRAVETLATVGYGDMVPMTVIGRVLGTVVSVAGILILAMFSGLITVGFMEQVKLRRAGYRLVEPRNTARIRSAVTSSRRPRRADAPASAKVRWPKALPKRKRNLRQT